MLKKVVRAGRATVFLVALSVILAAVMGAASMAFAANGKPFILGKGNVATKITTLIKKGPGPALRLFVRPGQPPLAVNSQVRVNKLNADKVDGKDAGAFLGEDQKAADSNRLDGKDSTEFLSSGNFYQKNELRTGGFNEFNSGSISCNPGDVLLSGGYGLLDGSGHVHRSHPLFSGAATGGWTVQWTGDTQISILVHCADLTP